MTFIATALLILATANPAPADPNDHIRHLHSLFAERFDEGVALEDTRVIFESGWRDRGNDSYQTSIAQLRDQLISAGFAEGGPDDVREITLGRKRATWNGLSASLSLLLEDGAEEVLLRFDSTSDPNRVALCRFSSSTDPNGEVFSLVVDPKRGDDVTGAVVLASGGARSLSSRYITRGGARGVLSASIARYNRPGEDDGVIQFGSISANVEKRAFGFQLSPAANDRLREAAAEGSARVRVSVDAYFGDEIGAPLLIATVGGSNDDLAPIWITAHLDEPGANDNASGCATAVQAAIALKRAIDDGVLDRPARAIVFLIGQEIEGPRLLLDARESEEGAGGLPWVGISLDMVGEDPKVNRAPFLIERLPDPSAVRLRPPDRHTEWGAGRTSEDEMIPHALDAIAGAALAVVAEAANEAEGFRASTNPYEGGSDHQPLLDRGIPALLFWHFTDWTYHTNRDTMEQVSKEELERTGMVTLLTAVELASGDAESARRALQHVKAQARERFGFESANAKSDPDDRHLRWAVDAYERWFVTAVESCSDMCAGDSELIERLVLETSKDVSAMAEELRSTLPSGG